jgi:dihydropteroate synthase
MGIVNLTPDSFYDGGRHGNAAAAIAHCQRLVAEGADILDIGAESTRPGAQTVNAAQQLDRLLPVLHEAVRMGVPISVDTSEAPVIQAALAVGIDIINDVRSLRRPGALESVAAHAGVGVCLMHTREEPASMALATDYLDVVDEVAAFLAARVANLVNAGVESSRIVIDPGVGFAKTADQNWELLRRQRELIALGRPLLVGWSRKSTLGGLVDRPPEGRLIASVAAALAAVERGASIVRVHDVGPTVEALKVWRAAGLGLSQGH